MMYTKEEKEKIYANIDKIKAYLDEVRPNLRQGVTVDFGPIKTYADYSREPAFHITVDKDEIRGRSGGLYIEYGREATRTSTSATVYDRLEYAVALIQNWQTIKATVHTAIQNQKQTLADIDNFEI